MSAEDELALPEVPEAKPEDPEDVSWALSTAEAMWARGDHLEGIKWVRKAAEAASDAEDDTRALELAKAASELTTLIARRSRAALGEGPGHAVPSAHPEPPPPQAPPAKLPVPPKSAPPAARSAPPIPLPSRASSAPPHAQPSHTPQAPRAAPRPLATSDARQGPQAGRGILTNRTTPEKPPPPESSPKQAGILDTAPHPVLDSAGADLLLRSDVEITTASAGSTFEAPAVNARAKRRSRPEPEPTIVGRIEDLVQAERAQRHKSVAEWDASPTQNLTGEEMDHNINVGDRATTAFAMPAAIAPVPAPTAPAARPPPGPRPPANTVHDPEIQTSQAVRVIVWRDANGVHIAPAGTVVSALTIDAVLVALEPSADLTAWLSHRER